MNDLLQAHLIPVDQAFRDSEARWGVGRLANLVSPETLLSFKRGFAMWSEAIAAGDVAQVQALAPKMLAALAFMDREADARGHAPLSVNAWEAATPDGGVLIVCRTQAEAHALAKAPDGRARQIWTVEELARVIDRIGIVAEIKAASPGARVAKLVQHDASFADDFAKSDRLLDVLHGKAA